eukprot:SAG22_NODE_185_length_15941_cov_8.668034_13_plen_81_part_01
MRWKGTACSSSSCCTTQHNTTQHNTTQHNTTQHNTTQHNTHLQQDHPVPDLLEEVVDFPVDVQRVEPHPEGPLLPGVALVL